MKSISVDSAKTSVANKLPIDITGNLLATNHVIRQTFDTRRVLWRDSAFCDPLLDALVRVDVEKPCSTHRPTKQLDGFCNRISFVHVTNLILEKLVLQDTKLDFLVMTGKKNSPTVPRMNTQETIGQRIKKLRIKNEMTMAQLAEKLGVVWQTVQQWENDKSAPKLKRAEEVAAVLGVTSSQLMLGVTPGQAEGSQSELVDGDVSNHDAAQDEHRAAKLATAICSILEGAGLQPDLLGTEEEIRTRLLQDRPTPPPHFEVKIPSVKLNRRKG